MLHGISDPSVCRVPRPDEPVCRVPRQGLAIDGTAEPIEISVEVAPVTYGWTMGEPGARGAATNPGNTDTEHVRAVLQRAQISANSPWMKKLATKDMSGPDFPVAQYLQLRDQRVDGNPRQTQEYREKCLQAVGLGAEVDLGH